MIRAASVDIDVNLRPLSDYLWQHGIEHRINEESGQQVVWVTGNQQVMVVKQVMQELQAGTLVLQTADKKPASSELRPGHRLLHLSWRAFAALKLAPVSVLLILACAVVAVITSLGREAYRLEFLFYPALPTDSLTALLGSITSPLIFLQTLAPMFLHFGELHIIFNMLWLWYFGRQLETIQPSWVLLLMVVITSFAANTSQYLYSQTANFGGMSGVVYGLVGYAWVIHNFVPGKRLMLNNSMFAVFVIALVLMELVASSWIASAAHLGGLIAGLGLGLALVLFERVRQASSV